jgi:flagellar basal-body rod protein FlgB
MEQNSTPPLLAALKSQMRWAAQRQTQIASNIANADTPGYIPKDVKKPDFSSVLKVTSSAGLTKTNTNHMQPRGGGDFGLAQLRNSVVTLNGNGVDLERESIEMAKTRDQQSLANSVYRKYNDMMRMTLRGTAQ